jgi:hypothetical protein
MGSGREPPRSTTARAWSTPSPVDTNPSPASLAGRGSGQWSAMTLILWIIAVILVIAGILAIVRGQALWGIVLIIVGLLVGPGGVSIFSTLAPSLF